MKIKRYIFILFCVGSLVSFAVGQLFADVIVGTAELTYGGWNFYLMQSLPGPSEDHVFVALSYPGLVVAASNSAYVAAVPDSTFEDLLFAPTDTDLYDSYQLAVDGRTYVLKLYNLTTMEITYAKIRFPDFNYPIMDYAYQPDGSLMLQDPIGTEVTTWGRIKALIR